MFKSTLLICAILVVVIDARSHLQFLSAMPGYVPVYIRTGDTPLEEINPELAEAFHELSAGRSANKQIEASPELPDTQESETKLETQPDIVDHRPYEKKLLEKKKKAFEFENPERR